jgi:hypothetical protein
MTLFVVLAAVVVMIGAVYVITKAFPEDTRLLVAFLTNAWLVCILIRWQIMAWLQRRWVRTALGVGLIGSIWVLIHAVELFLGIGASLSALGQETVEEESLFAWFWHASPSWVSGSLVALSVLLVIHQVREILRGDRERAVPRALGGLIVETRPYITNATKLTQNERDEFFEKVMQKFEEMLMVGRKQKIAASIMTMGQTNVLEVKQVYPRAGSPLIDKGFTLSRGQGAAGKAVQVGTVYVPSMKHLGGIQIMGDKYESVGLVFEQHPSKVLKGSLVAVRVNIGQSAVVAAPAGGGGAGTAVPVAALSIMVEKRNIFEPLDIEIVNLAATVLGGVDWSA